MDVGRHPLVSATPFYSILLPVLPPTCRELGQHAFFGVVTSSSGH